MIKFSIVPKKTVYSIYIYIYIKRDHYIIFHLEKLALMLYRQLQKAF